MQLEQSKAARQLEISRKTLLYRMGKYGISEEGLAVEQQDDAHEESVTE